MNRTRHIISIIPFLIGSGGLDGQAAPIDFENDIKPIFEARCLECHGPEKQRSKLRIDQRSALLRGGEGGLPSIVPGEPAASHLMTLIQAGDSDQRMPPKGAPLSRDQIALIERWITEGASWPGQMETIDELTTDHWSFQPVLRPRIPKGPDHPIDAFLAEALKHKGVQANPFVDPRSLARRASIILTGLPPTPQVTDRFLRAHQKRPQSAYIDLIDSLLASPHFGERWAQHWLDVIRWAETNGSEANLYRKNAWRYRDYVIRAFNQDKPYDQFVREQLAGDSCGEGTATGFLVSGPHVPAATIGREPVAVRQARADRMDEIIQTVGASIIGMTVGCARCHNHKFDPITLTDYYAMTAVFQDIEFGSRPAELQADHPRQERATELEQTLNGQRDHLRAFGGWEENWGAFLELHFDPVTASAVRIRFKTRSVGIDEIEFFGPRDPTLNLAGNDRGVRLSGFPEKGKEGRNPISRANDGEYGTMAWRGSVAKDSEGRPWLRFDFPQPETVDRLRISNNREYYYETDYLESMPRLARFEYDLDILKEDGSWEPWFGTWQANTRLNQLHGARANALSGLQKTISTLLSEGPQTSFVGRLIPTQVTRVFHRGSPENPKGEVLPAGPALLQGDLRLETDTPGALRRTRFADWLTRRTNPLTARVMVNRIWHHVFGQGIVSTPSDFGRAGATPTHPQLLDWLAAEFVEPTFSPSEAWSMKGLIRLMVTSEAFQRSTQPNPEAMAADAQAALLWRYPPQRVSAEVIRDSILQASGQLDRRIGGRSYRIHNVKKTYAQWEVVDNHGPHTWRRMLYQERMRRVDDQMFTAFDFPDCGQVRDKRPISTTPLQALNLLNSRFVVDQAELIADRASRETMGQGGDATIQRCFQLLLGRSVSAEELETARTISAQSGLHIVCRSLINANEFAFIP